MSLKAFARALTAVSLSLAGCAQNSPPEERALPDAMVSDETDETVEPSQPEATNTVPDPRGNPAPGLLPSPQPDAGVKPVVPEPTMMAPPIAEASCVTGQFCPVQEPDNSVCGKLELKTELTTELRRANILVVFDRSGSMEGTWGGVPKYQSAGNALLAALAPLQTQLTVGGVFFPSPIVMTPPPAMGACPNGCDPLNLDHWVAGGPGCCLSSLNSLDQCPVNRIEQPDQLDFGPADAFISGLPSHWRLDDPTGSAGTPLERGIERAAQAIDRRTFSESLMVLVMTDGEPNCGTNQGNVLDQVADWKTANISTYVVGLPGAQPAANFLTAMAQAGGTDGFIDPQNPTELEMRLRAVISRTVRPGFPSCTIPLQTKAAAPEKLRLFITQDGAERDVPRATGPDMSWSVSPTGEQVTLEGQLCKLATDGSLESLRFVFGCVDVPPVEPPPPPPQPD